MFKHFSFSSPVWLIPAVFVSIVSIIQTMHVVEHGRYCKTSDEWRQIYDQKAATMQAAESAD